MDNLKCLSDHVFAHTSVDFIDACETLRKELLKSMKIAKKFKEELKLANLEKEELVVRLDKSNKKNKFLRNQIFSQDEKMKSLEQELVEFKTKIENLTSTKSVVDNRSVSVSLKLKTKKVYIPHFKRNNKENTYFARLDKGKSLMLTLKFLNRCLNLLLESIINLFLFLLVTFVVLLVILDQIVLC